MIEIAKYLVFLTQLIVISGGIRVRCSSQLQKQIRIIFLAIICKLIKDWVLLLLLIDFLNLFSLIDILEVVFIFFMIFFLLI